MTMISYAEAQHRISEEFSMLRTEKESVALSDACGRRLAEPVIADMDLPAFDNSAVDGYAVAFDEALKEWTVKGEISAGNFIPIAAGKTDAVQIMTGGMMPAACDSVIPLEDCECDGPTIRLREGTPYRRGMNVRCRGEDCVRSQTVIERGTVLRPRHLAAAAACGRTSLDVSAKLDVAILATGDELIEPSEIPSGDKVRASISYALCASCTEMNMRPKNLGIVRDAPGEIASTLAFALDGGIHLLIITGGVSGGKRDFVKEALKEAGVELIFWRVNVKPGKPLVFGRFVQGAKRVLVFGLPGNPVSALVAYEVFVKHHLLHYHAVGIFRHFFAELTQDIVKRDGKRHFIAACASIDADGRIVVSPIVRQSSSMLIRMINANCFLIIDETRTDPKQGEQIECMKI